MEHKIIRTEASTIIKGGYVFTLSDGRQFAIAENFSEEYHIAVIEPDTNWCHGYVNDHKYRRILENCWA